MSQQRNSFTGQDHSEFLSLFRQMNATGPAKRQSVQHTAGPPQSVANFEESRAENATAGQEDAPSLLNIKAFKKTFAEQKFLGS